LDTQIYMGSLSPRHCTRRKVSCLAIAVASSIGGMATNLGVAVLGFVPKSVRNRVSRTES